MISTDSTISESHLADKPKKAEDNTDNQKTYLHTNKCGNPKTQQDQGSNDKYAKDSRMAANDHDT